MAVQIPAAADEAWQLEAPGALRQEEAQATLTRRKNAEQHEGEQQTEEGRQEGQRPVGDAVLWFSSLPPNDLRQAQKLFASGAHTLSRDWHKRSSLTCFSPRFQAFKLCWRRPSLRARCNKLSSLLRSAGNPHGARWLFRSHVTPCSTLIERIVGGAAMTSRAPHCNSRHRALKTLLVGRGRTPHRLGFRVKQRITTIYHEAVSGWLRSHRLWGFVVSPC